MNTLTLSRSILRILATLVVVLAITSHIDAQSKDKAMEQQVFYRTIKVDGLSVFYREAGPNDALSFRSSFGGEVILTHYQQLMKRKDKKQLAMVL